MTRKYDNTTRAASAEARRQSQRLLKALEGAKEAAAESVQEPTSRADRKRQAKERTLPPDRKCPECGRGPLLNNRAFSQPRELHRFRRYGVLCRRCDRKAEEMRIAEIFKQALNLASSPGGNHDDIASS